MTFYLLCTEPDARRTRHFEEVLHNQVAPRSACIQAIAAALGSDSPQVVVPCGWRWCLTSHRAGKVGRSSVCGRLSQESGEKLTVNIYHSQQFRNMLWYV